MADANSITAIIVAKNEEDVIGDALRSVTWCDAILHVDNGSTDQTKAIVKRFRGRSVTSQESGYGSRKQDALKYISTNWVIYLDADERITPILRREIESLFSLPSSQLVSAYRIPRRNIYLGREMKHGGWGNELVIRLFQREKLLGWSGILHEQPRVDGKISTLSGDIVHMSHRNLESMIEKTIIFTEKEADLRHQAHHPPISWWRFFRVMATEFWLRFIRLSAWADGTEGIIDGLFQVFNTFIIYARLWEIQQLNQFAKAKSAK